ncbi:hypothetical protein FIBSPDRAFT_886995 [Athelia psychrophila]|uniref:Uncharacterized protein n=1 Tax=Athelia psychrophila TaxID=1759441 RepID=A0A166Q5Y1_9AGAM|nr:hypothetical protein FIBSPDRAFT_886995 [Fibularhizoctonia sp. CBS 109695]
MLVRAAWRASRGDESRAGHKMIRSTCARQVILTLSLQQQIMLQINSARSISLERNILHNLDVPISRIPDEILAMIFEEGRRPRGHGHRFGVVLSHVSHCWRNVATTTPALWTYLQLQEQPHDENESPELLRELTRARAFLSRSRLCPVDIYIEGFEHVSLEFIQLIGEHVGHCRELRTREVGENCLDQLLNCFSSKPIPLLSSIDLSSNVMLRFPVQLFAHGAPCLTAVQLDKILMLDLHLHFAAFSSVTCLEITDVQISDSEEYSSFRDGLMALPSLHHLELQLLWFDEVMPPNLQIVLPTIQFLHIDATDCRERLGPFISFFHATYLATLSLAAWGPGTNVHFGDEPEFHLPSLKHLILADYVMWHYEDVDIFVRTFPGIERLTVEIMTDYDFFMMLDSWPKLQTIATSAFEQIGDNCELLGIVREQQEAGHPIRRLMLPETWLSEADAKDAVDLKKIVVVEDYYVDWPTPFEPEYFEH